MKLYRFFFWLIVLVSCQRESPTYENLTSFIPENSIAVIRSDSYKTLASDVTNNEFLTRLSKTNVSRFLSTIPDATQLQPVSEVLIAITRENDSLFDFSLITKVSPHLMVTDSLQDQIRETITTNNFSYEKITLSQNTYYTAVLDSVFVLSSSEKWIASLPHREPHVVENFQKLYDIESSHNLSIYLNGTLWSELLDELFPKYSNNLPLFQWVALDTDIHPDLVKINGITLLDSQKSDFASVFINTHPQVNRLAWVTPITASGFISYTFDDFETLQKNLSPFQQPDTITINNTFFLSLNEIGTIWMKDEKIIAAEAIDPVIAADNMSHFWNEDHTYRDISIKKIIDSTFIQRHFYPLISHTQLQYGTQLDDFFVFSESESVLHQLITDYQNETTLGHRPFYEEHSQHLSSAASVLLVALQDQFLSTITSEITEKHRDQFQSIQFKNTPMMAFQLVADGAIAHIHGVVKETKRSAQSTGIAQRFAIQLDQPIGMRPQFFTNHISKGKDIVVQDITNTLYLISSSGKILWKKALDSQIIGEIQEMDIYKNGRVQLVFTTQNQLYVLDRNGKEVAPFPLKFKDPITQPLALFDYDNNRNYRLLITQGKKLTMYDKQGKIVSGFTFKETASPLVSVPQHLRIDGKDYIVIAEENGTLHLLSRTGTSRISVSQKFHFDQPVFQVNGNAIAFLDADNNLISINMTGKVSTQDKTTTEHYVTRGKTVVELTSGYVKINNHLAEIPIGNYTRPEILVSNNRILITLTDIDQKRVYVFNSLGELLPGFPIYGTGQMDLGDATANGRPDGVVQGSENEVVCYEIN